MRSGEEDDGQRIGEEDHRQVERKAMNKWRGRLWASGGEGYEQAERKTISKWSGRPRASEKEGYEQVEGKTMGNGAGATRGSAKRHTYGTPHTQHTHDKPDYLTHP